MNARAVGRTVLLLAFAASLVPASHAATFERAAPDLAAPRISVTVDGLDRTPQLNAWTDRAAVARGERVRVHTVSNYAAFVSRAELRWFRVGEEAFAPLAVQPVQLGDDADWLVDAPADATQLSFVLRVEDAAGRYDETRPRRLAIVERAEAPLAADAAEATASLERGNDNRLVQNVPVRGGSVVVLGEGLPPGAPFAALGQRTIVDSRGHAELRQLLPAGAQRVELTWRDADGFWVHDARTLDVAARDRFLVAMGDLTVGRNRVVGPAVLVTGDAQHDDGRLYADARAAFYLKERFDADWTLTASADTREQPVDRLFDNFATKDPRYLLRRLNPDLYQPVYGDDSVTVDDAPTQGKFHVRLAHADSQLLWGNFQTSWAGTGTELATFARGLYGADLKLRSQATTSHGERRGELEAFAADPGTSAAREEFRGTAGSLYYLRHQDITEGSEQVWVEVRDRDSGLVLQRRRLVAAQDYEVNVLQGRLVLREGLAPLAAGGGLVLDDALGGQPQYLVVTYEYVPSLTAVDNLSNGVRATRWLTDSIRVGATAYHQGERGADQTLRGADVLLRWRPGTFVRLEGARSEGIGTTVGTSQDGGFAFGQLAPGAAADGPADAWRVETAVDLADVGLGHGAITAYAQDRGRGYSAPGQVAFGGEASRQQGGRAAVKLGDRTTLEAKADRRDGDLLGANAEELALRRQVSPDWQLALGVRHDFRRSSVTTASPVLSEEGARTDAQLRAQYAPAGRTWQAWSFAQGTLARDGEREANDRAGAGARWRAGERLSFDAEGSDGSLGAGVRVGADYRIADRTDVYLNYLVDGDSPLSLYRGRQDTAVAGTNWRVADDLRVFHETRALSGAGPDSLSHALGSEWTLDDHWTLGAKVDVGRLSDPLTGDVRRRAFGTTLGYRRGALKYSGNAEWRREDATQTGVRDTWLVRNAFGWQATPAWRVLGKVNWSDSTNSGGAFQDGGYREIVFGGAYRPVDDDRWNTLLKATYLLDRPVAPQLATLAVQTPYAQRSRVLSAETLYDATTRISFGGKVAVRTGELQVVRDQGPWFSSRADLEVLRMDVHGPHAWDLLAEWRRLHAREAGDAQRGALLAVYKRVANGVKVGAGYNFTRYSDDLTDLSYRSRGWFVNVLGTY